MIKTVKTFSSLNYIKIKYMWNGISDLEITIVKPAYTHSRKVVC